MKMVECLVDAKHAVPGNPAFGIVEFKEGDVIPVPDALADRLVELKRAKLALDSEEEEKEKEEKEEKEVEGNKTPWNKG